MVFNFMKDHVHMYPVENMAKVLGVSRAGYYKYINHQESSTMRKNNVGQREEQESVLLLVVSNGR